MGCCSVCCYPPCAMLSYRLVCGPVGPVLPAMKYCGSCPAPCGPCGPFIPKCNPCACCCERGCFGPFY